MTKSSLYRGYNLQSMTSADRFTALNDKPAIWTRLHDTPLRKWLMYSLHLPGWLLMYFFPRLILINANIGYQAAFTNPEFISYLLPFIMLVTFYYLNCYLFIPRFYVPKAYLPYFSILTPCLLIIILLESTGNQVVHYTAFLFIALSINSICRYKKTFLQEKEIRQLETALQNARINPHFLFNSLNWIYSLAIDASGETPGAIVQLSGLMRYMITDACTEWIELKKELNYIKNYLNLQTGKLGHTVSLTYNIPSYSGSLQIAPLLLMSFIENAFKYGVNPEEDSAINISITLNNNRLYLQIINNKVSSMYSTSQTGVGVDNAKQRLELQYKGAHQLEILDDYSIYSVKLSILLQ